LTLLAIITSSHEDGWIWALGGACAGVYLFYRGFRILQRKRLIENTPSSKIRSASMGLVEINGLAVGPYTMPAPITGVPCYYYHSIAWQLKQSGKNRQWEKVADESFHLPFYLDDNTGRLLVDPQGAEMDIHRDFREEFTGSFFSSSLDIPQNVSSFLMRHGVPTDKKVRIEECCIKPKTSLFVLGTLAENPGLTVNPTAISTDPAVTVKGHLIDLPPRLASKLAVFMSSRSGAATTNTVMVTTTRDGPTPVTVQVSSSAGRFDKAQQEKIAAAMMKAGITNPAAWTAAGFQHPGAIATAAIGGAAAAVAPAEEFDVNPKTILMKGERNPAFFISWQSQHDVVSSLSWKSTLMIWGGPALTLLCVYILAAEFGWL